MTSQKGYTYKYPRPALTTDCVVFGFDGSQLNILLVERRNDPYRGSWALPGGFMDIDETADHCARRELMEETNVGNVALEQFHTFTTVDRDPRDRVVSVAYYALTRPAFHKAQGGDDAAQAQWFALSALPALAFDHQSVIAMALERLRERLMLTPSVVYEQAHAATPAEQQALSETIGTAISAPHDR